MMSEILLISVLQYSFQRHPQFHTFTTGLPFTKFQPFFVGITFSLTFVPLTVTQPVSDFALIQVPKINVFFISAIYKQLIINLLCSICLWPSKSKYWTKPLSTTLIELEHPRDTMNLYSVCCFPSVILVLKVGKIMRLLSNNTLTLIKTLTI